MGDQPTYFNPKLNRGERKEGAGDAKNGYNTSLLENKIAEGVKNAALHVHKNLGPGLLESAYEECLAYTLIKNGWDVKRQAPMPLVFEEVKMDLGYRIDLLVENKVVVEVKAVEAINPVHIAQVLTYFKLSKCKLGLLINFHTAKVMDGFRRIVYNL